MHGPGSKALEVGSCARPREGAVGKRRAKRRRGAGGATGSYATASASRGRAS